MQNSRYFIKSLLLLIILILVALVYLNGITGSLYYDDMRPIGNLTHVVDIDTAIYYIFTETSGTLGRPISMLTFLLQVNSWPDNIENFFLFNIILHSFNIFLVFIVSYYIAFFYSKKNPTHDKFSPFWVALLAASFWGILPLNVSSSLIAIQRMTTLSSFFMLSGISLYLHGLYKQYNHTLKSNVVENNKGLYLQFIGLILFTLLAMFSKENGILLPVFIFIIEFTILNKIPQIAYRRKLRTSATLLGLIVIISYLIYTVILNQGIYPSRDFTVLERVQSQVIILFEYVKLAFFPEITAFNPFHDNYPIIRDLSWKVILAFIFWPSILLFALVQRNKYPLLSFAILWFLFAHLLESTVIALELYFEHRNYLALVGLCLAIVLTINNIPKKYQKLYLFIFCIYLMLLTFSLYQTTKLWGQPIKAAQAWFIKQPGSLRASTNLSDLYLNNNQWPQALNILKYQNEKCPKCISTKAQAMLISCAMDNEEMTLKYYNDILQQTSLPIHFGNTHAPLSLLQQHIEQGHCSVLDFSHLKTINTKLLARTDLNFDERIALYINMHQIAVAEDDQEENLRFLLLAWNENKDVNMAYIITKYQVDNKKYLEAKNFIYNDLCQLQSNNQLKMNKIKLACQTSKQLINSFINNLE
ncbi:MAG: hypothetical protein MJK12_14795 [Colwellia sp.]|nr:hypothetical protein [Colwellia sp.]